MWDDDDVRPGYDEGPEDWYDWHDTNNDCSGNYWQYVYVRFHVEQDIDLTDGDVAEKFYFDMLDAAVASVCVEDGTCEADDFSSVYGSRKNPRKAFYDEKVLKAGEEYWFCVGDEYHMEAWCSYTPATYNDPAEWGDTEFESGGVYDFDVENFESMMPGIKVDKYIISDPEE